jgi:hypothetical protein
VKPEDLDAARAIPELIYPEKDVVNWAVTKVTSKLI